MLDEWYGKLIALVGGMAGLYVIQGVAMFLLRRVAERKQDAFYAAVIARLSRIERNTRRKR